mmetsp:Transcript_18613/g.52333  ORF Transcript_18613/g.52333 Transcript_18613/m.52333 type:complete len:233 (+) Transcript_18613:794-1492(+)
MPSYCPQNKQRRTGKVQQTKRLVASATAPSKRLIWRPAAITENTGARAQKARPGGWRRPGAGKSGDRLGQGNGISLLLDLLWPVGPKKAWELGHLLCMHALRLPKLHSQGAGNAQSIRDSRAALDQQQCHLHRTEHAPEHSNGKLQDHMLLGAQVVPQLDDRLMSLDVGQGVLGVVGVMGQVGLDLDVEVLALHHDWVNLLQEHALQLHHLSLLLLTQVRRFQDILPQGNDL